MVENKNPILVELKKAVDALVQFHAIIGKIEEGTLIPYNIIRAMERIDDAWPLSLQRKLEHLKEQMESSGY